MRRDPRTEDKLVTVSIRGRIRAVRIRRSIFDEDGEVENGSDGGHTTNDGGCRE